MAHACLRAACSVSRHVLYVRQVMGTIRAAKIYLSLCVCIQMLKIVKFANQLVPSILSLQSEMVRSLHEGVTEMHITSPKPPLGFPTRLYAHLTLCSITRVRVRIRHILPTSLSEPPSCWVSCLPCFRKVVESNILQPKSPGV